MITHDTRWSEADAAPAARSSLGAPGNRPSRLPGWLTTPRAVPVVIVLLYLVVVAFGITTSSLGSPSLRQDPTAATPTTLGAPRDIRSDEWHRETPFALGMAASGFSTTDDPLAEKPDVLLGMPIAGSPITSIVEFDGSLMRLGAWLPDASLFAAKWWFPTLLVALALPPWMRRLGSNRPMSWLATALVLAAPATAWWSGFPLRPLGFTLASCVLGMLATEAVRRRRWVVATGQSVLAGLLLARLVTTYQPWVLTLGAPLLAATLAWLLVDRERRRPALIAIGVTTAASLVLVAGVLVENWSALKATTETGYPGNRLSTGLPSAAALLFGAPGDAYFQLGRPLTGSNVSELSAGFTFCAVWAFALYLGTTRSAALGTPAPGGRWWSGLDAGRVALGVLAVSTAGWLVWCTLSLGRIGEHIPLLNRVPANRAAQTVGFLAVLLVCLLLSRRESTRSWRVPVLAGLACAAVTAYGVSALQAYAPGIGAPLILATSAAVFAGVAVVTRWPRRWVPVLAVAAVAAAGVAVANPVQIGLGDLRGSSTADYLLAAGKQVRAEHGYWATDDGQTDSLLLATGVPALSGQQVTGPNVSAWTRIDPTHRYEDAWNRGGSSIYLTFAASGSPVVRVGNPDQILVQADPCVLARRGLHLTGVVSRTRLDNPCLTRRTTLVWAGVTRYVYRVSATG
jgi:hypothetical protein